MRSRLDSAYVLLEGLHPGDRDEAVRVERCLNVLRNETDPFDRFRYRPGHVTASAFVLHPYRQAILLIHHDKLDLWLQPGGHVEPGDHDVEMAARREVAEETGLVTGESLGLFDVDIHVFPGAGDQPRHLHFDLRWALLVGSDAVAAGDGVRAVRWTAIDDVLDMEESLARPARKLAAMARW